MNDPYSMNSQNVVAGEFWYVQLSPRSTLSCRLVEEVTQHTVVLTEVKSLYRTYPARYRKDEVVFVEKVEDAS
jgi:hypothetical protein